ncbi:hypothetical protein MBLNU230_g0653t1 [Neophaeotheca triangularis]
MSTTAANSKPHITPNTSANTPSVQEQLNLAIAANNGVSRIESVLRQRLDEQGWTQALREYTTALLRSGECKTFDEVKGRVEALVGFVGEGEEREGKGKAGEPDLKVGKEVQEGCVGVVKKELERVCVVEG